VGTGTKEDESSTGHVWAVEFHYVRTRSRLTRVIKLTKRLSLTCSKLFRDALNRGSADTGHDCFIKPRYDLQRITSEYGGHYCITNAAV
jgi:hypothetical protein